VKIGKGGWILGVALTRCMAELAVLGRIRLSFRLLLLSLPIVNSPRVFMYFLPVSFLSALFHFSGYGVSMRAPRTRPLSICLIDQDLNGDVLGL